MVGNSEAPDFEGFAENGFMGPIPIYTRKECSDLFRLMTSVGNPRPKSWEKGNAPQNEVFYRAGSDPRLLALVTPILGPDVILWGARTVIKNPDEVHAFHTDMECSSPNGRFVSIWIGLDNIDPKSGLKFVAGSHLFGKPIQQLEVEKGIADVDENEILDWAKEFVPAPQLVHPDVSEGLALVFDGRVWHGSHNASAVSRRTALLLQYAASSEQIYMPKDFSAWPPQVELRKRPPVIAVSGQPVRSANRIVDPPETRSLYPLRNSIHRLDSFPKAVEPFQFVSQFEGATPTLDFLESHTSTLAPGATPHPLHWHEEEELLVVVSGEAGLHIADDASGSNERVEMMGPGDFIYYPAFLHHTLKNYGAAPLRYTMFKWRNNAPRTDYDGAPKPVVFRTGEELRGVEAGERFYRALFDEPTHWLRKLHAHLSVFAPGAGYKAHADEHDVAIVLLAGGLKTLGRTVSAPAVLFHPAGAKHGLRSVGKEPARYIVFEFHGKAAGAPLSYRAGGLGRLRDWFGRRWLGNLRRIVRR